MLWKSNGATKQSTIDLVPGECSAVDVKTGLVPVIV
jgi:hypothetical protein